MQKSSVFRKKSKQFIGLVLIFSLLTVSIPAAPVAFVERVGQLSQDVRFGFFSSSLALHFPNWLSRLFASKENSSQTTTPSRIQIFPGSISVQQGEKVTFTAIGYDEQDAPVDGIKFDWRIADTGRKADERPLPNGNFEAQVVGTFKVTVEGGGQEAEATVKVKPSVAGAPSESSLQGVTPISISTKESRKNDNKDTQETQQNGQNLQPGEGVWNNGNWDSSDNPGNLPGNPPGQPADDGAGSGNFQIAAPVIQLPGRKSDLELNLSYNSRLWNKAGNELTYDIDRVFPAPGWSLGFGKLMDMDANGEVKVKKHLEMRCFFTLVL